MNVIEFKSKNAVSTDDKIICQDINYKGPSIAFCFIDNTHTYQSAWSTELIKNLSDFCISNIVNKGYDIFQSQNEDAALKHAVSQGYKHAVVFSTGTEFINGDSFFKQIEELTKTEYAIYGHILDRGDAYYELHHQCYLINLEVYKQLNYPKVGNTELGNSHSKYMPIRSESNIHDDYTPLWITQGNVLSQYQHKLHGWNIVSVMLDHNHKIFTFDESIRIHKKHYYPENQTEFLKHVSWAYSRYNYCANEFVHLKNTEHFSTDKKYKQIITPASGDWFIDYIDTNSHCTVVLYDYNQKSLDYWKDNVPKVDNVSYEFLKIDLLGINNKSLITNQEPNTLLNLSNIFCYEGTAMFSSLEYRLQKEQELLEIIPKEWSVAFSSRSALGFSKESNSINDLKKPTWHITDWL